MNDFMFSKLKKEYNYFYRNLLMDGKLPMRSTEKGFWSAADSDEVYRAFKALKLEKFKNFLDIGSGDGKVVLIASLFCLHAEGVEADRLLHTKAVQMRMKLRIDNARFYNRDFFEHDFSGYDALFLSPDTSLDRGIEKKLLAEMKGKLIHCGHHFQPRFLKKENSFLVNGNLFSVYSK